jgi:hypothetical protein
LSKTYFMKKRLLKNLSTTALLTFTVFNLNAQTPINASGISPTSGENYVVNGGSYVSPGNSGKDQTWYLGETTYAQQVTIETKTTADAGLSTDFPNGNIAFYNPSASFVFKTSNTMLQTVGVTMSGINIVYSDYEDFLKYPLTYGETHTDKWVASADYGSGIILNRKGTTSVTVDGHGTLYTPDGIFNNAYRVSIHQVYADTMTYSGSPLQTISYDNVQYSWYVEGIHYPVAQVVDMAINGSHTKNMTYINHKKSGIQKLSSNQTIIYPNPASQVLHVQSKNATHLTFTDISGKEILSKSVNKDITNDIYLNELKAGLYIVTVFEGNNIVKTEKITIE